MGRVIFAIPGDLTTRTGGYIYDRRVIGLLPTCGIDVAHLQLPGSFPYPDAGTLDQTLRALSALGSNDILLIDGLAWGAMPSDIINAVQAKIIALCHHPLGLEAGLSEAQSKIFIACERLALEAADHVIVTSATTAATLVEDFAVPQAKITIAEPGTERAPRARGGAENEAPLVLAVGSVVPRKGYDVLVEAMSLLEPVNWRLVIAGSPDRAPAYAAHIDAAIKEKKLDGRITLAGELDDAELAGLYDHASIFVSASHYEGYGMVLTEALVRGLPIVTTTGGAAAQTVPDDAALKVSPGDPAALARAIGAMLEDKALRKKLADAAWAASQKLPRWEDTAAIIAAAVKKVAALANSERQT